MITQPLQCTFAVCVDVRVFIHLQSILYPYIAGWMYSQIDKILPLKFCYGKFYSYTGMIQCIIWFLHLYYCLQYSLAAVLTSVELMQIFLYF